ncbi:MAG: 3' terminal RNA ribose 2'-O-methyltransferase Hen1 [Planctomycetia bacterium]
MLLTITTTHQPATDLGRLLHKHPDRFQTFDLSFGKAHVFYPEATVERTTAAVLLDVDPVGMVRDRSYRGAGAGQYVNDRPYVASSFLSVAIAQVFRTALAGRCDHNPELAATPLPLRARLDVLPARGGDRFPQRLFEPLGYTVQAVRHPLDDQFPDWGDSPYYSVAIDGVKTLSELLTHLYVLIPVFDDDKHYFVGDDELEKLLANGAGWLASHPEKEEISRRYLKHRRGLFRAALARLEDESPLEDEEEEEKVPADQSEEAAEEKVRLNDQRLGAVLAALRGCDAKRVLDLGCGEGKLLRALLADRRFEKIVGMDVSLRALEIAERRLNLERRPARDAERLTLLHGSLTYRDERLVGFDAAAAVEVIEHLDPPRLTAFERVVFEFARPATVVVTTPNREYNVVWETLPAGRFRHSDHRFEWTREEFQNWADRTAKTHGYTVRVSPIGREEEAVGPPTQMAVFQRSEGAPPAVRVEG